MGQRLVLSFLTAIRIPSRSVRVHGNSGYAVSSVLYPRTGLLELQTFSLLQLFFVVGHFFFSSCLWSSIDKASSRMLIAPPLVLLGVVVHKACFLACFSAFCVAFLLGRETIIALIYHAFLCLLSLEEGKGESSRPPLPELAAVRAIDRRTSCPACFH